jgi:uncharacterized protein (DUF1778 family)
MSRRRTSRAAAEAKAEEILRRQESTLVSDDFFEALLAELDQPAERNARLSAAARRGRDLLNRA